MPFDGRRKAAFMCAPVRKPLTCSLLCLIRPMKIFFSSYLLLSVKMQSSTRFESGCGWPGFFKPVKEQSVIYESDYAYGMSGKEVMCGRCKSHLGHVFDGGPPPTGLRYCINAVVPDFKRAQEARKIYHQNKEYLQNK